MSSSLTTFEQIKHSENQPEIPLLRGGKTESFDGVFSTKAKFNKYSKLPYNPKLKEKAKQLRKSGNLSEVLFWNKIKNKQVLNLDFERQKIIGNYIVDFYCAEINLVIEIDGESHDFKGEYDNIRDNYLRNLGLKVLHIEDIRVKKDLDSLINEIYKLVFQLKQENTPSDFVCHPSRGEFLTYFDYTTHQFCHPSRGKFYDSSKNSNPKKTQIEYA